MRQAAGCHLIEVNHVIRRPRPIRFSTLVASRRPSDDCRTGAAGLFHFAGGHEADVPACFHEQKFASPYGDDSSAADKVRNVRQHFCEDKTCSFLQILLRRRGYVVKTQIAQWQDRHSVGADVDAKRRSVPIWRRNLDSSGRPSALRYVTLPRRKLFQKRPEEGRFEQGAVLLCAIRVHFAVRRLCEDD